jgi:hypothetical protein
MLPCAILAVRQCALQQLERLRFGLVQVHIPNTPVQKDYWFQVRKAKVLVRAAAVSQADFVALLQLFYNGPDLAIETS